ncbi:MAG: hypothetical protein AAF821_02790 [Cyanobacteria bacterium P01_D01_bin.156]
MNTFPSNIHDIETQRLQLEQLWQPTPAQRMKRASTTWLRQAGQWMVKSLTEGDQPQIWTKSTKNGTYWYVNDPIDGIHHQFASESALRTWLEQRHIR